jgi:predicted ester cyclase
MAASAPIDRMGMSEFDFSAAVHWAGDEVARRNWDIARRHMEAEWSGDIDATMATMVRDDPFQIMHATGLYVVGFDAVRAFYEQRVQTFAGQGFFAHRWVVSDAAIVGSGYFSGRPAGVFFGVEATGKRLCLPMTVWLYFEAGLIKGEAAYLDGVELRRQLEQGTDRDPHDPVF